MSQQLFRRRRQLLMRGGRDMVQKQNAPHAALFLLVALVARAASAIPDGETLETMLDYVFRKLFFSF